MSPTDRGHVAEALPTVTIIGFAGSEHKARRLGNVIDNVVNATLEASEILRGTGQWREGKPIYCSFKETIKGPLG